MNPRTIVFLIAILASRLAAQDSRLVVEPFFPSLCATVDAQLTSKGQSLAAEDEQKLDTARIQRAIDKCGRGHAVKLRVNEDKNAFLSGPLTLKPDITLILDRGVTLFASRDAALYARTMGSCGVVNEVEPGCKPLISVDHAPNAAIMGDGAIDGRGGEKILNSQNSWWDLAEQARKGGRQQVPRLVMVDYSDNFTLYRVTLKNSPNYHVMFSHGDGFTVWGVRIDAPQQLARNTNGITPGYGVKNVTITRSYIRDGDENVIIKGGEGGATNMTISHNHLYWGHGMSIGAETSGGVNHIRVSDLSLDGTENGLRIKTAGSVGGLTDDVVYDDVCIRKSSNPITLDTAYTSDGEHRGALLPTMKNIVFNNVRVSGGGTFVFNGYEHEHRIAAQLTGVQITDSENYKYVLNYTDLQLGLQPTNLAFPAGTDSTVAGKSVEGSPASCAEKFVPFPE